MDNVMSVIDCNISKRQPAEDEYMMDGIIYCKQCNTPREVYVNRPITGERVKVRCMCSCQEAEVEAEKDMLRKQENERRVNRARIHCFGDLGYNGMTFDKDDNKDQRNSKRAANYAEHFLEFAEKGVGLLLMGGTGTGKSFHSACIANALLDRGYNVVMASVPTMVSKIQRNSFGSNDILEDAVKSDLLILDDLGAERGTDYAREQVYALIDGRYSRNRPMIISTNLTVKDMTTTQDISLQRIYGRVLEKCIPLQYTGDDRRRTGGATKDLRALLDM